MRDKFKLLQLHLDGVDLGFGIYGYDGDPKEKNDWPMTYVSLEHDRRGNTVHYQSYGEPLENGEIVIVKDLMRRLLTGSLKKNTKFRAFEPELQFNFLPNHELDRYGKEHYRYKFRKQGIIMTLEVFMDDSDNKGHVYWLRNSINVGFSAEDVELIYLYLCMITGDMDEDDDRIKTLIDDEIIIDYEY